MRCSLDAASPGLLRGEASGQFECEASNDWHGDTPRRRYRMELFLVRVESECPTIYATPNASLTVTGHVEGRRDNTARSLSSANTVH